MSLRLGTTALVLVAAALGGAAALAQEAQDAQDAQDDAGPSSPPAVAKAFEGEYAPIVRNNIFVKDRRPYVAPSTAPASRPAPPPEADPRKDYQLVGIVFEGGQFRAYFTSLKGGPTTRAAPGDALGGGVVSDVFIDAVRYRSGEGGRVVGGHRPGFGRRGPAGRDQRARGVAAGRGRVVRRRVGRPGRGRRRRGQLQRRRAHAPPPRTGRVRRLFSRNFQPALTAKTA